TGMVPSAKTTKPLLDSKQDEFGFIWPGGVIAAGVATGPKDVAGSNQDATAAVARAMQDMVEV
ncbi:MAG: heterodisulfide reductase subunit A, partial [Calditrichaeota bacterium]|nr:heterodisulfide reductase subunit A [Calditrichota bacterium]